MMQRLVTPTILTVSVFALLGLAAPAAAEPTPDQVAAIKANCRSDFLSNCRGVPRGGAEAIQCLKNNFANVSSGCQQAQASHGRRAGQSPCAGTSKA
jgi:hypothetical protein